MTKVCSDQTTTVLTRAELAAIRQLIVGDGAVDARVSMAESNRQTRAAAAAERRQRMISMDEERRAKGAVVKSMEDLEREAQRDADVQRAHGKLDEELDEVKHMNQVMLYAKCVTVRDAQVAEKDAIKAERSEEERRQDMAMELERLKALRMYEEREAKRIEDRRKGAAVIRAQIEERHQESLRRKELKQQEQELMLQHIDHMKQEDITEAVHRKERAGRLMEDVAVTNAEQIHLKGRQREMEQEEDRQIAQYIKEKELRDQAVLDEQRRIKNEKEMEIARLRSQQEKAQDKRAEVDALRARRAQDAYDREWRQREKNSAARAAAVNADLAHARQQQMSDKAALLSEQARVEKEEFERIVGAQKLQEEADRNRRVQELGARRTNADALSRQIAEVEEQRKKERRDFLEEGNKWKMEQRDREARIDAIRSKKTEEMQNLGIPQQYQNTVMKKRTMEPLRPTK